MSAYYVLRRLYELLLSYLSIPVVACLSRVALAPAFKVGVSCSLCLDIYRYWCPISSIQSTLVLNYFYTFYKQVVSYISTGKKRNKF